MEKEAALDECEKCRAKIGMDWNAFKMCKKCTKETNEILKRLAKKMLDNNKNQTEFKLPDLTGKFFMEQLGD